jgi:hypothetical protein
MLLQPLLHLVVLLAGCPWIGEGRLDQVRDGDGNGVRACAFVDDGDRCDCDDDDPAVGEGTPRPIYVDGDGDGAGGLPIGQACAVGPGQAGAPDDCDDNDPNVGAVPMTEFVIDDDEDGAGAAGGFYDAAGIWRPGPAASIAGSFPMGRLGLASGDEAGGAAGVMGLADRGAGGAAGPGARP